MHHHSPGPWNLSLHTVKKPKSALVYRLTDATGALVAQWLIPGGKARRLAPANAFVIKAAPDLLAVCDRLAESAAYWSEYDVPLGIVEELNAAILKARGGHEPDEASGIGQDAKTEETLEALRRRVKELEEMLYGIGAGGVGPTAPTALQPAVTEPHPALEPVEAMASGVADGWRWVPVIPNEAMKQARRACVRRKDVWRAMLEAAPQTPQAPTPVAAEPVAWLRPLTHPDWLEVCEADEPGAFAVYASAPAQVLQQEPAAWLATYQSRSGEQQRYVTTSRDFAVDTDDNGQPQPLYFQAKGVNSASATEYRVGVHE